jgi:hypothetical protein
MGGSADGMVVEGAAACADREVVEGSSGRAVTCVPESLMGAVAIGMLDRAAARDWKDIVSGGKKLGGRVAAPEDEELHVATEGPPAVLMMLAPPVLLLEFWVDRNVWRRERMFEEDILRVEASWQSWGIFSGN